MGRVWFTGGYVSESLSSSFVYEVSAASDGNNDCTNLMNSYTHHSYYNLIN